MLEEPGVTETIGLVSATVTEPEVPVALRYVESLFASGV
jgi:hypothetical protein